MLLVHIGRGICTEEDMPHRNKFTIEISKAWKQEREEFAVEKKVFSVWTGLILWPRVTKQNALGRVSLTTDAWSNTNLTSFLGVTAHCIVRDAGDGHLLLQSGLLAFRHIQGSHTGENLARILSGIIHDLGITNRVSDTRRCPQTIDFVSDWLCHGRRCSKQ